MGAVDVRLSAARAVPARLVWDDAGAALGFVAVVIVHQFSAGCANGDGWQYGDVVSRVWLRRAVSTCTHQSAWPALPSPCLRYRQVVMGWPHTQMARGLVCARSWSTVGNTVVPLPIVSPLDESPPVGRPAGTFTGGGGQHPLHRQSVRAAWPAGTVSCASTTDQVVYPRGPDRT